jgi:hypothetical protein
MRRFTAVVWMGVMGVFGGCSDTSVCRGDVPFSPTGDIVAAQRDDVCIHLARRAVPEEGFVYKALPYALQRVVIQTDSLSLDVDEPAAMQYTPTHHNWEDAVTATEDGVVGDVIIRFALGENNEHVWSLAYAITDGDASVDGTLALSELGR